MKKPRSEVHRRMVRGLGSRGGRRHRSVEFEGGPFDYRHGAGCRAWLPRGGARNRATHGTCWGWGGCNPGTGVRCRGGVARCVTRSHRCGTVWFNRHKCTDVFLCSNHVACIKPTCQAPAPCPPPAPQDLRLRHAAACHRGTCQLRHGRQRALQAAPGGGGGAGQRDQEQHQGGVLVMHGRRGRTCRSRGCQVGGHGERGEARSGVRKRRASDATFARQRCGPSTHPSTNPRSHLP